MAGSRRPKPTTSKLVLVVLVIGTFTQLNHPVEAAPTALPLAGRTDEMKADLSGSNQIERLEQNEPWPTTTEHVAAQWSNQRGKAKWTERIEETAAGPVIDTESLSSTQYGVAATATTTPENRRAAQTSGVSVVDDSSIKANEPNRTTSDESATLLEVASPSTPRPRPQTSKAPDGVPDESSSLSTTPSTVVPPSPRKKIRRTTSTTSSPTTALPLINPESMSTAGPISTDRESIDGANTSTSTTSYNFGSESSASAAPSTRPKNRKTKKKVSKRPDLSQSTTQATLMITSTIIEEETLSSPSPTPMVRSSHSNISDSNESADGIRKTWNLDRPEEAQGIDEHDRGNVMRVPSRVHETTTFNSQTEEETRSEETSTVTTPTRIEKYSEAVVTKSIDSTSESAPSTMEASTTTKSQVVEEEEIQSEVNPEVGKTPSGEFTQTTTPSEENELKILDGNIGKAGQAPSIAYTTSAPLLSTQIYREHSESLENHGIELVPTTQSNTKIEQNHHARDFFVTHTPSEVSSSYSTQHEDSLRLTSTTVFEDSNSAITTTTEFISRTHSVSSDERQSMEMESSSSPDSIFIPFHIGEENVLIQEDKAPSIAPTTEPHVDAINVENLEENLSPISDDDVLVVEIEESSETIETMTPITTTTRSSGRETDRMESRPPPKLNQELFYPIGSVDGGVTRGISEEKERDEDDEERRETMVSEKDADGRSNDNDGGSDFDLEAEIFPTIPAPKNPLFDSEILHEKETMTEDDMSITSYHGITPDANVPREESTGTTTTGDDFTSSMTTTTTTIKNFENKTTEVSTVSHDSDTFFYISNTEVKVIESTADPQLMSRPVHKELSFAENTGAQGVPLPIPDQNHTDRGLAPAELNRPSPNDEDTIILSSMSMSAGEQNHNSNSKRVGTENEFMGVEKFVAADRPHRLSEDDGVVEGDREENEGVVEDNISKRVIQHNREELLSFVRVEETTDVYSSEEAFEFLHNDQKFGSVSTSSTREEDTLPDIVIEPYPQLDNDLPISIGVPIIAELPQQIRISDSDDKVKDGLSLYALNNRDVDPIDTQRKAANEKMQLRKRKKLRDSKKPQSEKKKKAFDRDEQFSEFIFDNAESLNFLVKNPSISLEVPVIDFNFSILTSTTSTEPRLNFTNETTLVLEDEQIGINDLQTLFLTCFITLALLVAAVVVAFVARFLWNQHYSYGTGLIGDNSTDPLASKTRKLSVEEFKSRDSGISLFKNHHLDAPQDQYDNGIVPANSVGGNKNNGDAGMDTNGTRRTPYTTGANGSIITMTLKNNHLIVETEERSDISRDARETKMHYSPSEKDGVFVVEVARGADTSYHSPRSSMIDQQQFNGVDLLNTSSTRASAENNKNIQEQQRVQVHHHPEPEVFSSTSTTTAAQNVKMANGTVVKCSTGLSQSDLSDSSSGSNKDYNYGNQGSAYAPPEISEPMANAVQPVPLNNGHSFRSGMTKQETIDLEPRLQSDIDLFNVETERRDHCNGRTEIKDVEFGRTIPDILVKGSTAPQAKSKAVES